MIYDWLFEPESLTRPEFDLDHYVALWDLTNRQDARNCEWQQEGLHARPLAHGNFVPQEAGVPPVQPVGAASAWASGRASPHTAAGNGGGMSGMA